jgi:hypothetical protein
MCHSALSSLLQTTSMRGYTPQQPSKPCCCYPQHHQKQYLARSLPATHHAALDAWLEL